MFGLTHVLLSKTYDVPLVPVESDGSFMSWRLRMHFHKYVQNFVFFFALGSSASTIIYPVQIIVMILE